MLSLSITRIARNVTHTRNGMMIRCVRHNFTRNDLCTRCNEFTVFVILHGLPFIDWSQTLVWSTGRGARSIDVAARQGLVKRLTGRRQWNGTCQNLASRNLCQGKEIKHCVRQNTNVRMAANVGKQQRHVLRP